MPINKAKIQEVMARDLDLLERKNADYSSMNILIEGTRGVVTRLIDKVARVKNLLGKPEGEVNFESVLDTFGDIVNYGLIGQLLQNGGWQHDVQLVYIASSVVNGDLTAVESALSPHGIAVVAGCSMIRSGGTPYNPKAREAKRKAIEIADVMLVISDFGPTTIRDVEFAKNIGKRVIIVSPQYHIWSQDCENYPDVDAAVGAIIDGGFCGKE